MLDCSWQEQLGRVLGFFLGRFLKIFKAMLEKSHTSILWLDYIGPSDVGFVAILVFF